MSWTRVRVIDSRYVMPSPPVDISVDNDQNRVVRTHLEEGVFDANNEVSVVEIADESLAIAPLLRRVACDAYDKRSYSETIVCHIE